MNIKGCQLCPLYKNQSPIQNNQKVSDIMMIGISSQKNKHNKIFTPLDISTNSGKFTEEIERQLLNKTFYKTNLIKCVSLSPSGKIRYPTPREMNSCLTHLKQEIRIVQPKIIITLGKQTTEFLSKHFNIRLEKYKPNKIRNLIIIPIDHPSYLMIYKRKNIEQYKKTITTLIKQSL